MLQEVAVKNKDFLFGDGPVAALQLILKRLLRCGSGVALKLEFNFKYVGLHLKLCIQKSGCGNLFFEGGGDLLVLRIDPDTHTGC